MNYATLCTDIQAITENTFSADQLAMFVQQAEQRIYHSAQLPSLRRNSTGTLASGNKYLSAPTDFLAVHSLAVIDGSGNYTYLLPKDVNFMREAYPNPSTTGTPRFYAIFGPTTTDPNELSFIVAPTPSASLGVELHYFYVPASIVTAGTSWLGDNFDSVLLNGALVEAIRFMKGEADLVKKYDDMYVQSLTLLKNLGDGKMRRDSYRNGQLKAQVS